MPKDEGSGSLFDLAGKMQKKKEKITPKEEPKKDEEVPPAQKAPPQTQEELAEAFLRCKQMHDELKNKIETAYEGAKVSPRKFQEYVKNPTHFSAKDWQAVQKTRNEYDEKLRQLMPEQVQVPSEGVSEEMPEEEKKKIKSSLLSRKRWLSMH